MNSKVIIRNSIIFLSSVGFGVLLRSLCSSGKKTDLSTAKNTIVLPPPEVLVTRTRAARQKMEVVKDDTPVLTDTTHKREVIQKQVKDSKVVAPDNISDTIKENTSSSTPIDGDSDNKKTANDNFPLQLGSKGKRVENLQLYLLYRHGWADNVTGVFDTTTKERVAKFLKVTKINKSLYKSLNMDSPIRNRF